MCYSRLTFQAPIDFNLIYTTLCKKGLMYILDALFDKKFSKWKVFADDKVNITQMAELVLKLFEKKMGKEENAGY